MPVRPSLNISLTPELAAYVGGRVASGQYRSASEVVRAGLRLLQRDEAAAAGGPPGRDAAPPGRDAAPPGRDAAPPAAPERRDG